MIPNWQTPPPGALTLLVVIGCVGAVGHFALVRGFRHASASLLSPFLYSQVLFASAVSLFWFGDPLRATTVLGTAILVSSGLYIWWRENRRARTARQGAGLA